MMRGNTAIRTSFFLLLLAVMVAMQLVVGLSLVWGADASPRAITTSTPALGAIEYRRVFVPSDKVDAWPLDGEKLIPIESRDFDALIHAANTGPSGGDVAVISSAEYTGHLDSDGQLRGTGQWKVIAHGEKPTLLPISNLSLILRNPQWQGRAQLAARIGRWGASGNSPGKLSLEVKQSGTLQFDWQAQTRSVDDQIEIPWATPASGSARLKLDLPQGMSPRIQGGVVLEDSALAPNINTTGKSLRRWVIGLAAFEKATMRIGSANRKPSLSSSQAVLHEEVEYRIEPRGLEVKSVWTVENSADPIRELTVAVPAGMQLTSIQSDGRDVSWRLQRNTSATGDTVIVDLPKPKSPNSYRLSFLAWQPVVIDASWRLPRLIPEKVAWSSSKFELSATAGFELKQINPSDCIEMETRHLNAGVDTPEFHSFSGYAPAAGLEVVITERLPAATIRAGSSLALADPNLNGRLVTQWKLSHGATHRLIGKLSPGWLVEAIETTPSDAMTEWFIDRIGDERQIEIQLSHAATATQSITVIVTARLQRLNVNEPISADTMKIVKWSNAKPVLHLLTFQPSEPYAAVPTGRMPEVTLAPSESGTRELLETALDGKVFDITEASPEMGVKLTMRRGRFAAHIEQQIISESDMVRQTLRVAAEPKSAPIDRILAFTTTPLPDGIRWVDAATNASITAERLSQNDPQRSNLPREGEVWQLRFAQPISRPVEVTANFTVKQLNRGTVPLLYLPEAEQQDARIVIRGRNHSALWLDPVQMQPAVLPTASATTNSLDDLPPVIAVYRYDPTNCRDVALTPKLTFAGNSENGEIPLVARQIQLESFVWPTGKAAHRATYKLQSHGSTDLKLALPSGMRLLSASLDHRLLEIAVDKSEKQLTQIHLPGDASPTQLTLNFESQGLPLAAGRELTPPTFLSDLSFLAGDWTVWLPEEYDAVSTASLDMTSTFNWRNRIFGVLGRPAGALPFNPLRPRDADSVESDVIDGTFPDLHAVPADRSSVTKTGEFMLPFTNLHESTSPATALGWRRYHESFVGGTPAPIVVIHPAAITAWSAALLIASFVLGQWLRRKSWESFAASMAIAAGAALLLPIAYFTLASGAVLGLLLSLLIDCLPRSIHINAASDIPRSKSASVVGGIMFLFFLIARHADAQLPQAGRPASEATNKIFRVLIPSDSERRPVGTKYYLSDEFLRTLSTAAANSGKGHEEWLLSDAVYSGELSDRPENKELGGGNWLLTFSVETLARDTVITIPLIRDDANWNAVAMLDGIPVPLEWRNGGHECAVNISEPGRFSLSLSCIPKLAIVGGRNRIELRVPSILGASVHIHHPGSLAELSVAHATVFASPVNDPNSIDARLDATDRLAVNWSIGDKPENGATGFSVTELRWLHVKRDALEATAKYVLEGGVRRPDSITVTYDERWKLLSEDKSNVGAISTRSPGKKELRIPINRQSTVRQEVTLHWQLEEQPALGIVRLPLFELSSMQPTKRWLAVSNDPAFDCEILDPTATIGTANEFLAKWGDAETNDPPDSVLSAFDSHGAKNLSIRPRETEPIVEEALNVGVAPDRIRIHYDASITPGLAGSSRVVLAVPDDLSISEISVTEDDHAVKLRWSRSAKKLVTVFFGKRLTNTYRLLVDGSTSIDSGGKASFPHISTLATVEATLKTRLYREDDVQVTIEGMRVTNDPKAEPPGPAPVNWSVRPIGVYYLENDSTTARIVIKPNKLKLSGDSLIHVSRENGIWWMTYRCQLLVEEGNVDHLKLRIPENCTGPFEVQSALTTTTDIKSLEERTAVLLIRYAATISKGGTIDLRIRSPIKTTSGVQVSVPSIELESLASGHRYVAVPEAADSQAISWTEIGVRSASVQPKIFPASMSSLPLRYYEVVTNPFQVSSHTPTTPEVAPQIRLVDTVVISGESGSPQITTRLTLSPHGLTNCIVQLPSQQSLVSIEIDGNPAMVRRLGTSQWEIGLVSPRLPQIIEVISVSAESDTSDDIIDLQRPTLVARNKAIPAEMSLWSFAHPQRFALHSTNADQATAVDQAALRFDRLVSIAEAAKANAAELPSPDGYNWFLSWANILGAARTDTQQSNFAPASQPIENQVSHTAGDQIAQAEKRFEKWLIDCRKTLSTPEAATAGVTKVAKSPTVQLVGVNPKEWTYYVAEGGNDRLSLQLISLENSPTRNRIVGILTIVGLLVGTFGLMRYPAAIDCLYRWPHACGILLGIGFWAWLWPSWLGIVIAATNICLALRFTWPGRLLRTEASTVLRTSRTI